ncbi:MAG: ATP-binding protein [Calditrichaeota bacterium]|nr:MAG: ATP-binding protein [Calditrichota bacterium]
MRELSLNILDIITNSVEAEATRVILVIEEWQTRNLLRVRIRDNGRGMSDDLMSRVLDPFVTTRTTRSVGMGLSLFRQIALSTDGDLVLQSALGVGTTVTVDLRLNHLNRPPLGRISDTVVNLAIGALDVHFYYIHHTESGRMIFDSFRLFGYMEETGCGLYQTIVPMKEKIQRQLKAIHSSAL